MKKNFLFIAMLWAFACLFCTSCNNKKDGSLVEGSPYVYEVEGEIQEAIFPSAIITFEEDGTFKYECYEVSWQDPEFFATIQGKWNQRLTEDDKIMIVLNYDLSSFTSELFSENDKKDLYEYFANENQLVENHQKQNELYGFGPGYIGANDNFFNDQGEIILYSISGNVED